MATVNIHEAKTHLSRLVAAAARGEEVVIARAGKPVAKLVPLNEPIPRRKPGLLEGRFSVVGDFDAALPAEVLAAFEGR